MIEIIKNFLNNQIVINWIAPIITGLVVVAIPAFTIRVFQSKKDKRKVDDANRRYLNSIRPYIIQKIRIDKEFISDVRKVVIKESCIKEKYIYGEVELRNKLILDITEDNYINEVNKKDLLDFTYEVFKGCDVDKTNKENISNIKNKSFLKIDRCMVMFILSLIICTIIQFNSNEEADLNENMTFSLSYVIAFFSFLIVVISHFNGILKSKVSSESNIKEKIINSFFEEVEEKKDLNENNKNL